MPEAPRFVTQVCSEGSDGNLRVTIPWPIAKHLTTPGWVRLRIIDDIDHEPFFGFARRPPSRSTSATITLPPWRYPQLQAGALVEAAVTDAAPYRALPQLGDAPAFDWLSLLDHNRFFVTEPEEGRLVAFSRYAEPFALTRFPDEAALFWLLGFYQAEGSKSDNGREWTLANTNLGLLGATRDALEALGIERERQRIEVLHPVGMPPEEARAVFAPLGLRVAATRVFSGRISKTPQATLHIKDSYLFQLATKAALARIFEVGFPSKRAAERFAIGWLDGDGSFLDLHGNRADELRLAGLADEHRVVAGALRTAFGWAAKGSGYINNKQGTHITLRVLEVLQLVDAGAFRFSMNRARLFAVLERRTDGLRALAARGETFARDAIGQRGALARWGLIEHVADGYRLSAAGRVLCDGCTRHADEMVRARRQLAAAPKGVKNLPYRVL